MSRRCKPWRGAGVTHEGALVRPVDSRRHAEATQRNREPILRVLERVLPESARVLEVASGTGEHAVYFAQQMPAIEWQPSDADAQSLASIRAWKEHSRASNVGSPFTLDVLQWAKGSANGGFAPASFDALFCANLIHIAPWEACLGLMNVAQYALRPEGLLITYGPYRIDGRHTAPSNERFDEWLNQLDARFGVRDLRAVVEAASAVGLRHLKQIAMPANNFCLLFERAGEEG